MGVLRTLLALFVVLAHIDAWDDQARTAIGGGVVIAVNFFFLISGFYMALVLTRKYSDVWAFYKARALRLYPIYWTTLALTLALLAIVPTPLTAPLAHWDRLLKSGDYLDALALAFANLTFIGLDLGQTAQVAGADVTRYTLLPQAWTLGIEITFYAMIPVILKYRLVVAAVVLSLAVKAGLLLTGFHENPWERQIFFAVLIYFMLGVVAFWLYERLKFERKTCWLVAVATGTLLLAYAPFADFIYKNHKTAQDVILHPLMFAWFTLAVPYIFALSKDSVLDRIIGELSYPIYISHLTAISVSLALFDVQNGWLRTIVHLTATGIMAFCLALMSQDFRFCLRRFWPVMSSSSPAREGDDISSRSNSPLH